MKSITKTILSFALLALCTHLNAQTCSFDNLHQSAEIRYGDFKKQLAEDVVSFVSPIREKIEHYINDDKALASAAQIGAEKANESAAKTLKEVREIIGFKKFY